MNLLTKQEIATKLKASRRTIEYWVALGIIPQPIYIQRRALWVEESINAWLQEKAGLQSSSKKEPPKAKPGRPRNIQSGKTVQI
ncbi:MAG: helix-turn-helix transcriptional regulator [Burkholderiales bacterium]